MLLRTCALLIRHAGMQKKWGWQCRYVQQYNAIGEAPDEVRQCFQQRSRWCKGHFQTFWSKQCPLVDRRLGILFQLCYSSTCLSYISAGAWRPALRWLLCAWMSARQPLAGLCV
jgi:cellulose synthase/poly-beta-1,6-N-acetylglucosamine synthase-like glycosyltransferase